MICHRWSPSNQLLWMQAEYAAVLPERATNLSGLPVKPAGGLCSILKTQVIGVFLWIYSVSIPLNLWYINPCNSYSAFQFTEHAVLLVTWLEYKMHEFCLYKNVRKDQDILLTPSHPIFLPAVHLLHILYVFLIYPLSPPSLSMLVLKLSSKVSTSMTLYQLRGWYQELYSSPSFHISNNAGAFDALNL